MSSRDITLRFPLNLFLRPGSPKTGNCRLQIGFYQVNVIAPNGNGGMSNRFHISTDSHGLRTINFCHTADGYRL